MLSAWFSFQWFYALVFAGSLHPIHVSVTEIEYDEKDKALEVMMRIFIDDTETLMRERLKQPGLDIMNPGTLSVDKMLSDYIQTQFAVSLDNKAQTVKYIGHEKDGDVFIVYLEVNPVKKWKTITVRNGVFTDIYDDQSNLVHVTVRGTVRSLRLTRGKVTDNLTFEIK